MDFRIPRLLHSALATGFIAVEPINGVLLISDLLQLDTNMLRLVVSRAVEHNIDVAQLHISTRNKSARRSPLAHKNQSL
jgi:hypothetical protein